MSTEQRIEHDAWGDIPVPGDHLWGAQTQRSIEHFAISTERMPPELLHALALVKSAAARVNERTQASREYTARAASPAGLVYASSPAQAARSPQEARNDRIGN